MISVFDELNYVRESGHDFTKCPVCGTLFDFEKDDLKLEFYEPYPGRVARAIPLGYYIYKIKCPNCHDALAFDTIDVKNGFK